MVPACNLMSESKNQTKSLLNQLEEHRIQAASEESIKTRNLKIMRKFMTGFLDGELQQSLLTSYTGEFSTDLPATVVQIH